MYSWSFYSIVLFIVSICGYLYQNPFTWLHCAALASSFTFPLIRLLSLPPAKRRASSTTHQGGLLPPPAERRASSTTHQGRLLWWLVVRRPSGHSALSHTFFFRSASWRGDNDLCVSVRNSQIARVSYCAVGVINESLDR